MENLPEEEKVVDLLKKMKTSNGGYPSDMLAARRRTYLKQMANVGLGIGIGAGLKAAAKGAGNGAGAATTVTGKVLEIALVAAIALEAGTAAYLYRDKIAEAVRSYINQPAAQEVVSSASEDTAAEPTVTEFLVTPSPAASGTPTGTPSGTPSSSTSVADSNNQNNDSSGGANTSINANATPKPGGNQGNQYGLTPKPVRTKDDTGGGGNNSGGGGGSGGGGNNSGGGGGGNNANGGGSNKNNKP